MKNPDKETLEKWHKDPSNWRGSFYYNKSDKRVFVPKQTKLLGWTLNFANPNSLIAILAIALLVFLLWKYFK